LFFSALQRAEGEEEDDGVENEKEDDSHEEEQHGKSRRAGRDARLAREVD
jgi:hypothetical protein